MIRTFDIDSPEFEDALREKQQQAIQADRKICTPMNPMPPKAPGHWIHTNAHEVDSCYDECCVQYLCTNCNHTWWEELPE